MPSCIRSVLTNMILSFQSKQALLAKPWKDPSVEMGNMIGLPSDHVLPEDEVRLYHLQGHLTVPPVLLRVPNNSHLPALWLPMV